LDRPGSVLVAPAQYVDAIVGNVAFAQFMESLFVSRTILFVGSSLEGIQVYLEGVRFRPSNRRHSALVAVSGRAWETKGDLLRMRYGMEVIPYPVSDTHKECSTFLESLAGEVAARQSRAPGTQHEVAASRREPTRLKKITLERIGLFDRFELELKPHWNI